MKTAPQLPNPHPDNAGRGLVERIASSSFARVAKLWTPTGALNEQPAASVSRYALQLIDRLTGKAYSADELVRNSNVASAINDGGEIADPIDGDKIPMIEASASESIKWISFENVWTWVKSKLDGVLTIAGAKTLSGQLELTGQLATNATSAMNRALGDTRYGRCVVMRLATTQDITSASPTFADITGTDVDLEANSDYEISGFLAMETLGGSPTNRAQLRMSYTGALQTNQGFVGSPINSGTFFPMINGAFLTTSICDTTNADRSFPIFGAVRTSTAGTMRIQGTRITGAGTTPKLLAGSFLIFRKI